MKRTLSTGAVVAGLLLLGIVLAREPHWLFAAQKEADKEKEKRTLNTSGTATIRVKPDSARVFFKVETYAVKIQDARNTNGQDVKRIMDAVRTLKIDNLRMKSTNVHVGLVTDRRQNMELPRVLGYHITNTFTVLVEDGDAVKLAEAAGKVLDTALANGATGVDQIAFFRKDVEEVRREALTKAVEDALRNARALAKGAERNITDVAAINGQPQYHYARDLQVQNAMAPGVGADAATPLVAGDLEITCSVSVVCRY